MKTNLERAYSPALPIVGHSADSTRQIAQFRHQGWLLELEQAMLNRPKAMHEIKAHSHTLAVENDDFQEAICGPNFLSMVSFHSEYLHAFENVEHGVVPEPALFPGTSINTSHISQADQSHMLHTKYSVDQFSRTGGTLKSPVECLPMPTASVARPDGAVNHSDSLWQKENRALLLSHENTPNANPYVQRNVHFYHDAQGIQAWIRDGNVSSSQAHAIASVMSRVFHEAGTRLFSLTLNGKSVLSRTQDRRANELEKSSPRRQVP